MAHGRDGAPLWRGRHLWPRGAAGRRSCRLGAQRGHPSRPLMGNWARGNTRAAREDRFGHVRNESRDHQNESRAGENIPFAREIRRIGRLCVPSGKEGERRPRDGSYVTRRPWYAHGGNRRPSERFRRVPRAAIRQRTRRRRRSTRQLHFGPVIPGPWPRFSPRVPGLRAHVPELRATCRNFGPTCRNFGPYGRDLRPYGRDCGPMCRNFGPGGPDFRPYGRDCGPTCRNSGPCAELRALWPRFFPALWPDSGPTCRNFGPVCRKFGPYGAAPSTR